MNANSKKLLSWLCVIALVLSMAPVMNLSNFAVETKAAEEQTNVLPEEVQEAITDAAKIQKKAVALDPKTATTCPMCDAENITWKAITASQQVAKDGHYYVPAGYDSNSVNFLNTNNDNIAKGDKVCILLNEDATVGGRFFVNKAVTINFAGDGSITQDGSQNYDKHNGGIFQVGENATINLYGGKFIGTQAGDANLQATDPDAGDGHYTHPTGTAAYYGNFSLNSSGAKLNIFAGAEIIQNTTRNSGANIVVGRGGTVNMYGGTISGGKGFAYHYENNPTSDSTVEAPATGATWTNAGGNVYLRTANAKFNMYGGTISGGSATQGGNIYAHSGAAVNIVAGNIEDGVATSNGGNIEVNGGKVEIDGTAQISGGKAANGGNISVTGGTFTANGGKIMNGVASGNGGNIYVNNVTVNLNAGTQIIGGTSNSPANGGGGGNIYVTSASAVLNTSAVIKGGKTTGMLASGGNINLTAGTVLNISGGEISGGKVLGYGGSAWGGNVRAWNAEKISMSAGIVYGGYCARTSASASANIGMQGDSSNKPVLEITGGVIVGDVNTSAPGTYKGTKDTVYKNFVGTKIILANDAKIVAEYTLKNEDGTETVLKARKNGLNIYRGKELTAAEDAAANNTTQTKEMEVDISGLNNQAQICISPSAGAGQVIALSENAEQVVGCFTSFISKQEVVLNGDKTGLVVATAAAETEAQNRYALNAALADAENVQNADLAYLIKNSYCPICGALSGDSAWTNLATKTNTALEKATASLKFHFYLDGNVNKTYSNNQYNCWVPKASGQTFCLAMLNDPTLTLDGMLRARTYTTTINIMGEGTITGTGTKNQELGLIAIQGSGNVNLYGGTFLYTGEHDGKVGETTEDVTDKVPRSGVINVKYASAVVNIHEGVTIGNATPEGGVINTDAANYNVFMTGGKVNMYGGTIQNGVTGHKEYSGNVYIANSDCYFNMYGGTITGGSFVNDANAKTYLDAQGITTENIVKSYGGNVYVGKNADFNMYGGTITGGSANDGGGNIYLHSGAIANITGGLVTGGHAKSRGGNICVWDSSSVRLNISGKDTLITNGTSDSVGGNIYAFGKVVIKDSTVSNGFAKNSGGNIGLVTPSYKTTFEILGAAKIINGNAGCKAEKFEPYFSEKELREIIKENPTISSKTVNSGVAGNGGNIHIVSNSATNTRTVTIGPEAEVSGGLAATHYNGKITQADKWSLTAANGKGGNIYVTGAGTTLVIQGKVKDGNAYKGGNIYADVGVINLYGTVDNGYAYGQGGNVGIEGSVTAAEVDGKNVISAVAKPVLNMYDGAKIQNGKSVGQGASIRGYLAEVNMYGGEIFGGDSEDYDTDNVWVVSSDVNMYGGEIKNTPGVNTSGLSIVTYDCLTGDGDLNDTDTATLYLSGNAKLTGLSAPANRQVYIDNNWTGVLYAEDIAGTGHKPGDTINSVNHITGTWVTEGETTTFVKGGSYNGKIYYGKDEIRVLADNGTLCLSTGAAIVTKDAEGKEVITYYFNDQAAVNAYNDAGYVQLSTGGDIAISKDVAVDLNGKTANITGTGNVELIDTANKDFETSSGSVTIAEGANVEIAKDVFTDKGDHYIVTQEDGAYTAHYVEMALKTVSLRTTADGLYYKVEIKCDEALAARVGKFGVAVQLTNPPEELNDKNHSWSYTFEPNAEHTVTVNSLELFGILKDVNGTENRTAAVNYEALKAKVYANLYMIVDTDGDDSIEGEETIFGKPVANATGVSLYDVVAKINELWATINATDKAKENMVKFVQKWATTEQLTETGLSEWTAITGNINK